MSRWGLSALLVVLLVASCGDGAAEKDPARDATPQAAWTEGGTVHVVQGDVERRFDGQWQPWLWLPDGDLLLHTPPDSSGMAVYRPASGKFVVKTDDEWGRDKYDGGEYGLDSETGAITAKDALLRIVDGDQPADLDQGPPHDLVDYDDRLEERARVELPGADEAGILRDYDFPVRVGGVTFIAFEDTVVGGDLTDPDNTSGGIVRVEDGRAAVTLRAPYVQRLFLSSDATSVLAVTSKAVPEMGDVVADDSAKDIIELDPVTGRRGRDLGTPQGFSGLSWEVERVDRTGVRVAAQIGVECGDAPDCAAQQTWVHDGSTWSEVADQRGRSWYWQAGGAAVSWSPSGPIGWTDPAGGKNDRRLAGKKAGDRVASGTLLPPG